MKTTTAVAITPRDRIDRVLGILAKEVGPRLLADHRIADVEFVAGRHTITVGQATQQRRPLDAADCCKVILAAPAQLFGSVHQTAASVKYIRDRWAHPRWEIAEFEAVNASTAVAELLRFFGRMEAAREAERFRAGPMIRYVTTLRSYLVDRTALPDPLVSYEEALCAIQRITPNAKMSEFLRQLNVLAALQLILGEPQLCSLVVRADSRIPGDGFYWTVGMAPSASVEAKTSAHRREVAAVRKRKWRASDDSHALPW